MCISFGFDKKYLILAYLLENHNNNKMSVNLEERKLNILEYLSELEDETIILQIENLLKPKVDFWEELSDWKKNNIKKGIHDFEKGKRIAYDDFKAKFFKK